MSRRGCASPKASGSRCWVAAAEPARRSARPGQRGGGEGREKIALIEMSAPLGGARSLVLRKEPLVAEERVISRAYRDDSARNASGRFVEYGTQGRFAGSARVQS